MPNLTVMARLNGVPVPLELDADALGAIAVALGDREGDAMARRYLTVKNAAAYVGLSEHAFRHLLARYEIPRHQAVEGGRILLARDDLDRWLVAVRR